ncbi:MAG TPA: hypothetical protein VHX43_07810 [Xanthobacteraceae bacterium]|nr:hypothetical protein [Xanthobacteraceae bacterium]
MIAGTGPPEPRYEVQCRRKGNRRAFDGDQETAVTGFASFGFWTCAAIYAAIGIIGIVLLGAQPSIAYSNDGYGAIGGMTKQPLVTPQRWDAPKPPDASAGH